MAWLSPVLKRVALVSSLVGLLIGPVQQPRLVSAYGDESKALQAVYLISVNGEGTGGDFVEDPLDPVPGIVYEGDISASWTVFFDERFTLDRSARTVDAEPITPVPGEPGVTLSVLYSTGYDSYTLTATSPGNSPPPITCTTGSTVFDTGADLADNWGFGPSAAAYKSGVMSFTLTGVSAAPNGHCSNGGGFPISGETVPGYAATWGEPAVQGRKTCHSPESPLSRFVQIPVAMIGKKYWVMEYERTFTCQQTLLGALYTAKVRYWLQLWKQGASNQPALADDTDAISFLQAWQGDVAVKDYGAAARDARKATAELKDAEAATPSADRASRADENRAYGEMTVINTINLRDPDDLKQAARDAQKALQDAMEAASVM